jgi:hypothetical protein
MTVVLMIMAIMVMMGVVRGFAAFILPFVV